MANRTLKIVIPVAIVLAGVAVALLLASARETPERVERPVLGPLVEVMPVSRSDVPVVVRTNGQVVARRSIEVVPQVGGRVVEVAPSLVAGGFFSAGRNLLVIDPRDFELAVERARAAVARARVNLERERAEAEVAREEWDRLNPDEAPPSGLVVREPQVRQAEAELDAAQADLETAKLALQRTRVSVPFDGVVASESVDVGQMVAAGRAVATVYGTGAVEVRVPVEDEQRRWFEVPRNGSRGPSATVIAGLGGVRTEWTGRVTRMEADVDPASRMARVVVEVDDPYRAGRPPLLPGSFVEVAIEGGSMADVAPVPRHAVHEGDTVWVVSDGRLEIRPVEVLRRDRETVYVGDGLAAGERIVVSPLDAVTDGMKVRVAEADGPDALAVSGGAA